MTEPQKKPRESPAERLARLLAFDGAYTRADLLLAGMDEVGRGPLAGPVVACCLLLPPDSAIVGVNDSKKVSEAKRTALHDRLTAQAVGIGLGMIEAEEIDDINILNATRRAFACAFANTSPSPQAVLVDAMRDLSIDAVQHVVVHGDALSYRIAAASIVAKVVRDRLMCEYDAIYPQYGFARHKGYGTAAHIEAIRTHGPCPIHRRSFIGRIV